uniref:Uncharacterized protein n=1 Tax=Anguilla anguilla TaxID=7936 RepID=A0A0E9VP27_ANGAN
MSPCSNAPDSNEWVVIKLCRSLQRPGPELRHCTKQ